MLACVLACMHACKSCGQACPAKSALPPCACRPELQHLNRELCLGAEQNEVEAVAAMGSSCPADLSSSTQQLEANLALADLNLHTAARANRRLQWGSEAVCTQLAKQVILHAE